MRRLGRLAALAGALGGACTVALAAALPLAAQQPRAARPLPAPAAELEEPWSGPLQLVELRDGRVLVHDQKEKRVAVADLRTQEVRDVAREGSGPTEFRMVLGMWRMPGDSVQLFDIMQQRMLIFDPTGTPRLTRPLPGANDPAAMMTRPFTRALDGRGRWYGEQRAMSIDPAKGVMTFADSIVLIRTNPATMQGDTLAKMPMYQASPRFGQGKMEIPVPGYPPLDAWGVFPDGRVLIMRAAGYVPEIVLPDGTRRRGAALPYVRLPVTAADRKAMMDSVRNAMEEGMKQARAMAGNQPMPEITLVEPNPWQAQRPPLTADQIRIDPKGRGWVPVVDRTPGQRYDLVDAEGRVVDAIKLERGVILLGFGAAGVYTARKDADDLLYVRRHPLP